MFRFIRYKIANKKWLNISLLAGIVLLSAFLAVFPMFKQGSLDKLIQTLMIEKIESDKTFPAVMETSGKIDSGDYTNTDQVIEFLNKYEETWTKYVDIDVVTRQQKIYVAPGYLDDSLSSRSRQFYFDYIDDYKEHTDVVYGVYPEDAADSTDENVQKALAEGAIPCVISQYLMDKDGYTVGEVFNYSFKYKDGEEKWKLVITGIIEEKENDSYFWHKRLANEDKELYFSKEQFTNIIPYFAERGGIYYREVVLLNYTQINSENAEEYYSYLTQFSKKDKGYKDNFSTILANFMETRKTINVILFTFELPIVALLLLFIYMISSQILEMETGEIAMLKSRGVSRFQVIRLYLLQSAVIAFAGTVIGLPLGYLFCKVGASTDAFLVFTLKDTSIYQPNLQMLLFAGIGYVLSLMFMTLPVISLSKYTITERSTRKIAKRSVAFWEKFFLDIPILVLSLYLLYNYLKQKEAISMTVISGGSIDPIIFLDSSLFIIGCGLLGLRIIHLVVKLIYRIGKKLWKPAEYVSFLQIIRNSRKQGFISVFLVMTIAMGIFNANLARSVNENMEQRINYNQGCDYRFEEKWPLFTKTDSSTVTTLWNYTEPDFRRFDSLKDLGVESMTRVVIDNKTEIKIGVSKETNVKLMAINTKEFGETAELQSGLNDKHWYYYLNDLGQKADGLIISSNLAEKYNIEIGQKIIYSRYSPIDSKNLYASSAGYVVGIVDAFPGYESTEYTENADGTFSKRDNYLIVANYQVVMKDFRTRPYEIWLKLSDKTDSAVIDQALDDMGLKIRSKQSTQDLISEQRNSTLIQITNGMFSIGFIISLTVCGVGFLIYWILTIKERELIYGIYRSMGMTMGEIIRMLVVEQIFSSIFACIAGFGVGMLTTVLFTKLISVVYLPRVHNIPVGVIFKAEDSVKMMVIVGLVLIICFIAIIRLIKNMNITKALKLGDD